MLVSSPSMMKNTLETTTTMTTTMVVATIAATTMSPHPPMSFQCMDTLPNTQRGLNKPKCIQCGNIAHSR